MRAAFIYMLGLTATVFAQTNTTTCCNVSPNTVDPDVRLSWCRAQQNSCPEVCANGQTSSNTCDSTTLTFNCKCLTGNTPNISDYSQTLPSLECDEWKAQCTNAHPNDLTGQNFCQSFVCGKKNASATASGSSGSGSGSGSGSSGSGGGSSSSGSSASGTTSGAASTTSKAAAAALRVGREYGTSVVLLGLTALFGLAL